MQLLGFLFLGFGLTSTILVSVKLFDPACDAGSLIPLAAPFRLLIYLICLGIAITLFIIDHKRTNKKRR